VLPNSEGKTANLMSASIVANGTGVSSQIIPRRADPAPSRSRSRKGEPCAAGDAEMKEIIVADLDKAYAS
jgi:hypothetical protein